MDGLEIAEGVWLPWPALTERAVRSPGPGGQNVNKVATAIELRAQLHALVGLSEAARVRLAQARDRRLLDDGTMVIQAHRYRTLERNRADAGIRLADFVRRYLSAPKPRVATKPTQGAKRRRLDSKRARGQIKKLRKIQGEGE